MSEAYLERSVLGAKRCDVSDANQTILVFSPTKYEDYVDT
jgi:hypothetical protein